MLLESDRVARELHTLVHREMSAALLDYAPDGILAVDESGRVATINAMAARLLGHARAQIEGRNLIDLLRPSVRGDGMAWLRDLQGRGAFDDVCALRGDGALASLQLAVRAIQFDGRVMFACYLRETRGRRRGDPVVAMAMRRQQRIVVADRRRMRWAGVQAAVSLVVADVALRAVLEDLLRRCGWQVQGFDTADAFVARTVDGVPHCAVIDVDMPDLDALAVQARTAADRATLPIIFLTDRGEVPTSVRVMEAGAFAFLAKPLSENALLTTIHDAIALSAAALEHAALARALGTRHASLTPRECDVMRGVVSGLLNKQVAAELGISEITVKAHRGRVMRKMQARSLPELVNFALILGLAP